MKKTIIILSVLILIFGFNSIVFCADSFKIGVINFERIVQESSAGKIEQQKFKKEGEKLQQKLQGVEKQINEMKKKNQSEAMVLSQEELKKKTRELRIKINDFNSMQQSAARTLKQLEAQSLNKMQKQIFEIAKQIGNQEKYSLIIEHKTAGIIFRQDTLDITDQVIKKYNLKFSKTK